jgi:hypothetical protein
LPTIAALPPAGEIPITAQSNCKHAIYFRHYSSAGSVHSLNRSPRALLQRRLFRNLSYGNSFLLLGIKPGFLMFKALFSHEPELRIFPRFRKGLLKVTDVNKCCMGTGKKTVQIMRCEKDFPIQVSYVISLTFDVRQVFVSQNILVMLSDHLLQRDAS